VSLLDERLARAFDGRRVLQLGGAAQWSGSFSGKAAEVTLQEGLDTLPDFGRRHDALFAPEVWSRLPSEGLDDFLRRVVQATAPGALIAFLGRREGAPSAGELIGRAAQHGWGANVELLPDYWLLTWWAPR
jgi:hypothetical protein